MTTSNDPDQIRADIERTRAELSYNVDSLTDTANPKHIADRQVDKVKDSVRGVRDKIMGSPDDPDDGGRIGDAGAAASAKASGAVGAVGDAVSGVGDAVAGAPSAAKQKTQGNPMAAGLIAFGAGLLISSLIPSTRQEREAVSGLQENLEPLKQKATDVAKEMADNLRGPAQEAAEAVKSTAQEGAQNVKSEGETARDKVQGQAQDSKSSVQDTQSS